MDTRQEGQYYDFNCHALLSATDAAEHRRKGCDVDTNPQSYYEEQERAAGAQS